MFKSFIWMFKQSNFKSYCKNFLLIYCKFILTAFITLGTAYFLMQNFPIISILLCVIAILFLIAPNLYILGYFWELTENIINREVDIFGESIYNGKLKQVYKITLPELDTNKFLVRGFASIVAMLLLVIPFIILFTTGIFLTSLSNLPQESIIPIIVFIYFFIPALLWNYASRNSIFAVWNVRKAIYIMGNYTGRYLINTILIILFNLIFSILLIPIFIHIKFNTIQNPITIPLFFACLTIYYLVNIYIIHVNAYLLGTIAKIGEE